LLKTHKLRVPRSTQTTLRHSTKIVSTLGGYCTYKAEYVLQLKGKEHLDIDERTDKYAIAIVQSHLGKKDKSWNN